MNKLWPFFAFIYIFLLPLPAASTCNKIEAILQAHAADTTGRPAAIAREFLGCAYAGGTLEADTEELRFNTDKFDCTTLVETVLALSITCKEGEDSCQAFRNILQSIRYRSGIVDGYCSRLHYIYDWALENEARGYIIDVTPMIPGAVSHTMTLDYMTTHRSSYPALADESVTECVRNVEQQLSPATFMIVPKRKAGLPEVIDALNDGDIVAFTTSVKGLDVSHIGFVIKESDGITRLLHASSGAGKVIIDPKPLALYVKSRPSITGIRVFRITD